MFRQMVEEKFFFYLMLMAVLGAALGFLGTLLIYVILSLNQITGFLFSAFEKGWG